MDMLQKLYQGKYVPTSELGRNASRQYSEALEKYQEIIGKVKSYGVPDELMQALDKVENELFALEEERIFCFAMKYGADLQRCLLL